MQETGPMYSRALCNKLRNRSLIFAPTSVPYEWHNASIQSFVATVQQEFAACLDLPNSTSSCKQQRIENHRPESCTTPARMSTNTRFCYSAGHCSTRWEPRKDTSSSFDLTEDGERMLDANQRSKCSILLGIHRLRQGLTAGSNIYRQGQNVGASSEPRLSRAEGRRCF